MAVLFFSKWSSLSYVTLDCICWTFNEQPVCRPSRQNSGPQGLCMRLLSARLIVSLILGITLVSSGFSYYEVLSEKRALRSDLERRAELFGESLAGNVERVWTTDSGAVHDNELQR